MRTLRQLLAAHGPLLLIDASSTQVQVGWLESAAAPRWAASTEESGVGIFRAVNELGLDPGAAGGFLFCDGPGSILGIRTAAMAVRTWNVLRPRPVFAYHSLALVAEALGRDGTQVIADARRDSWHVLSRGTRLRRVPTAELAGALVMPENFRHWTPLPPGVDVVPYRVDDLLARTSDAPLLRGAPDPDAFLHEEPAYVTWTPSVHRAP